MLKIFSSSSCLSSWAALLFATSLIFLFFCFVWLPVLYLGVLSTVLIHLVPGKAFCVTDASFCLNVLVYLRQNKRRQKYFKFCSSLQSYSQHAMWLIILSYSRIPLCHWYTQNIKVLFKLSSFYLSHFWEAYFLETLPVSCNFICRQCSESCRIRQRRN